MGAPDGYEITRVVVVEATLRGEESKDVGVANGGWEGPRILGGALRGKRLGFPCLGNFWQFFITNGPFC